MDFKTTAGDSVSLARHPLGLGGVCDVDSPDSPVRVCAVPDWVRRSKVMDCRRQGNAPVTSLLREQRVFVPDRAHYFRIVNRLESAQAVQQFSNVELQVDPESEVLLLHGVTVFRGGALTRHERTPVEWLRREEKLGANVLDGTVCAVLVLKDVRTGDVLDVEYTRVDKRELFANMVALVQDEAFPFPVGRVLASWTDAAGKTFRSVGKLAGYTYEETEEGGLVTREWKASDVPARLAEPNVPSDEADPFMQCGNVSSWGEIATELLEKWSMTPADRSQLDREVSAIREESAGEAPRVLAAVLDRVGRSVRYQAVSKGMLGLVPEDLGKVWERKYGDCKEKTMLMVWFLRELGFEAVPVLVNTKAGRLIRRLLPWSGAFDHVVARVRTNRGELWIDPTDIYRGGDPNSWRTLPFAFGLPLMSGSDDLVPIPDDGGVGSVLEVRERLKLDSTSLAGISMIEMTFFGGRADWLRALFDREGVAGLINFTKALADAGRRGLQIDDDPEWHDDLDLNAFRIKATGRIPDMIRHDSESGMDLVSVAPFAFNGVFVAVADTKRMRPLAVVHPCEVRHEVTVEHPSLREADYPRRIVEDEAMRFECGSRMDGTYPLYWFHYRSLADRVDPKRIARYKIRLELVFKAVDIFLRLPVRGRRPSSSGNPEHGWGGGPSVPKARVTGGSVDARAVIWFVFLLLFLIYTLIRVFI
ncbi:MAG: DUF3857 domain-containing protein [Verrucomicrobia bacterium]|nr:DUF3857 domain-containing protein [Verrucomicrobiota bacterium]